jgi:hypothetical protein
MSERPTSQPLSEHLLQLKDGIFEQWGQLPPEHQASMLLVLYTQVTAGEYGPWLRSSIDVMEQKDTHGPYKFLPILRISPEHLILANLTEEEIARLDEDDLRSISYQMVRHYTNDVFWEELEFMTRKALEEKQQE